MEFRDKFLPFQIYQSIYTTAISATTKYFCSLIHKQLNFRNFHFSPKTIVLGRELFLGVSV